MVEVKLVLYDPQEIVMLAQLEAALAQKRSAPPAFTQATEQAAPEQASPVGDQMPSAPAVDDIAMQKAITEFAQRPGKGVPAARELLTEFGASKVTDVPQERRAEFLARLAE